MALIDPTSDIGRIRLRISDIGDLPYLNDSIIQATLDDCGGNLPAAAKTCAMYVLGLLSHKTRRKLAQLEVFGGDAFKAYQSYLLMVYTNPAFMSVAPIPYSSENRNIIQEFSDDWNKNFYNGTSSQALALSADLSPNDGSRFGFYGNAL